MKINTSKKLYLIIIPGALAFLVLAYGVYAYFAGAYPFTRPDPFDKTINYEKSDTEKAREQEIKSNPEEKLKNDQRDIPTPPKVDPQTSKQSVNVLLTYAGISNGKVSASGFVSDISQEGGACQYIFTKDDQKITKDVTTLTNPTSTTCSSVNVPESEFSAGVWNVSLTYDSTNASGVSSVKTVSVP